MKTFEEAKNRKEQRDKEEPLGTDKDWGELEYLVHVWTLDKYNNEDQLIFQS